jgi:hypothetical protein
MHGVNLQQVSLVFTQTATPANRQYSSMHSKSHFYVKGIAPPRKSSRAFSGRLSKPVKTQAVLQTAPTTKTAGQHQNGRHLIVMVHGLFGSPSNWETVQAHLQGRLPSNTLLYASQANALLKVHRCTSISRVLCCKLSFLIAFHHKSIVHRVFKADLRGNTAAPKLSIECAGRIMRNYETDCSCG